MGLYLYIISDSPFGNNTVLVGLSSAELAALEEGEMIFPDARRFQPLTMCSRVTLVHQKTVSDKA